MLLSRIFTSLFVEDIGCQIVHFVDSLIGIGIYGNFSAMSHMDIVVNIDGHRTNGWLKRDGSCCEKISELLMVQFS